MMILWTLSTLRFDALPYGPMQDGSMGRIINPILMTGVVVAAAVVAAAIAALCMLWWRRRLAMDGPQVHHFARECGLNHAERRAMFAAARLVGVQHPATLCLSIGCFDHAASRYERAQGPIPALAQARRKLFAESSSSSH